ncbi:hypothetical protein [Candidatus Hodgkinia cicadicola]|uniref:hypothetical protein n=1 Tax=Candidatus Hodgkinia cicadicola TaxID=573658 RepID=UPI001788DD3A
MILILTTKSSLFQKLKGYNLVTIYVKVVKSDILDINKCGYFMKLEVWSEETERWSEW